MKKIYIVLDECGNKQSSHETLKEAKDNCYGEYTVLEVTDVIESDYVLKYKKKKLSEMV